MSNFTVDPDLIGTTSVLCTDLTWLAEGFQRVKAGVLLSKLDTFLQANPNVSDADLANFLGTTTHRVELMYAFYDDAENLAGQVAQANQAIPFLKHPTQTRAYLPLFIVLTVLTLAMVLMRIYSRIVLGGVRGIRSYDWLIIGAFIMTLGLGTMNSVVLTYYTWYRGNWDRSWTDFVVDQQTSFATSLLYPITILIIKTSLLIFYYQLTIWRPLRVMAVATFCLVVMNTLASVFGWIFQCKPVLGWVGDSYMTAKCTVDRYQLELATGIVNIVTDVIIWMLPLPMVWTVLQSLRERLLATFTFGIGALACIACGIRLRNIRLAFYSDSAETAAGVISIWTITELYLAISCASVPAIRALLIKKAPKVLSNSFARQRINGSDEEGSGATRSIETGSSSNGKGVTQVSGLDLPLYRSKEQEAF